MLADFAIVGAPVGHPCTHGHTRSHLACVTYPPRAQHFRRTHRPFRNASGTPSAHLVYAASTRPARPHPSRIWRAIHASGMRAAYLARIWRTRSTPGTCAGCSDAAANVQICQVQPFSPGIEFSPHEKIFTCAKCLKIIFKQVFRSGYDVERWFKLSDT